MQLRATRNTWILAVLTTLLTAPLVMAEPSPSLTPAVTSSPTPTPTPTPAAPKPIGRQQLAAPESLEFDRSEGGTLYFKVPSGGNALPSVKADLYDVSYLGNLKSDDGGLPYFIFTGRPCADCSHDRQVFILRPNGEKPTVFVYPGRILDPRTGERVLESRAFYGHCLRGSTEQYVVFQKERIDRKRRLQSSVFVAEPHADHLAERLIERGLPRIEPTLKLVRQKLCHEVDGRYRTMKKRSIDLRSRTKRAAEDSTDDDEDSPPRENQTDQDISGGAESP